VKSYLVIEDKEIRCHHLTTTLHLYCVARHSTKCHPLSSCRWRLPPPRLPSTTPCLSMRLAYTLCVASRLR
ncbi:hypothetical protein VIGAN_07087400, partial [Vigna angularis var. angularis]